MGYDQIKFLEIIDLDIQTLKELKFNCNVNNEIKESNEPIIELKNVSTIYEGERLPTLHNISFTASRGEFILIIGPNGSGKTTLLETISGLLPTNGTISVFGHNIRKYGPRVRKRIGYVIQGLEFEPNEPFLVKDIVMIGRSGFIGFGKHPRKIDWLIVRNVLRSVGMLSFYNRPIGKLSMGQQQKVMIAFALASEPELLLLDEPYANLDINARREIYHLLIKLRQEAGVTMLCVAHNQTIPQEVDRVLLMQHGKIVLDEKREVALNSKTYKAFIELSS